MTTEATMTTGRMNEAGSGSAVLLHPVVGHPSNGQKISENSSCISRQLGYCGGMKTNMTAFEQWTVENKHTLRELYSEFLKDTGCTYEQWKAGEVESYEQFLAEMWKNCKGSK